MMKKVKMMKLKKKKKSHYIPYLNPDSLSSDLEDAGFGVDDGLTSARSSTSGVILGGRHLSAADLARMSASKVN